MSDGRSDRRAPGAPWTLSGRAWVALFKAPADWVRCYAPDWVDEDSGGGIGSIMFVDYDASPVGPYRELLIAPGRFAAQAGGVTGAAAGGGRSRAGGRARAAGAQPTGRRRAVITHIYVDSEQSVAGGRRNWGLPKELAEFEISPAGAEAENRARRAGSVGRPAESLVVRVDGRPLLRAALSAAGPRFPVATWFLPLPLMQQRGGTRYFTEFRGSGWGRLGRFEALSVDVERFPDVSAIRPRFLVRVDPFHITFPPARETEAPPSR